MILGDEVGLGEEAGLAASQEGWQNLGAEEIASGRKRVRQWMWY